MLENEKKGNIKIKFQLPWDEDLKNSRKDFREIKDEIYRKLIDLYLSPTPIYMKEGDRRITNQWNILRAEVIRKYLSGFMYPSLEKNLRDELTEKSGFKIIKEL